MKCFVFCHWNFLSIHRLMIVILFGTSFLMCNKKSIETNVSIKEKNKTNRHNYFQTFVSWWGFFLSSLKHNNNKKRREKKVSRRKRNFRSKHLIIRWDALLQSFLDRFSHFTRMPMKMQNLVFLKNRARLSMKNRADFHQERSIRLTSCRVIIFLVKYIDHRKLFYWIYGRRTEKGRKKREKNWAWSCAEYFRELIRNRTNRMSNGIENEQSEIDVEHSQFLIVVTKSIKKKKNENDLSIEKTTSIFSPFCTRVSTDDTPHFCQQLQDWDECSRSNHNS